MQHEAEKEFEGYRQKKDDAPGMDRRKIIFRLAAGIVIFLAIIVVISRVYHDQFIRLSEAFVQYLGGVGVALGFFLTDAFPIPLPPDPVMIFASLGNMKFLEIVAWGSFGSLLGGSLGFFIGRQLAKTRLFAKIIAGKQAEAYEIVRKYGVVGLAVCTVTPLPYVVASWASGALKMPFPKFFLVSLLRIVRVTGYMLLIQFGIVKLF